MTKYRIINNKNLNENIKQELEYQKIYNYLKKYTTMECAAKQYHLNPEVVENKTIWVFWMQGLKVAPNLVKTCIDSVEKFKPQEYELVLLTWENISKYVTLPDFVWKKYENGSITLAHLSDILRLELLHQYGGCWIDATVYCSGVIPRYMLDSNFFIFKWSNVGGSVLKGSSWWMCAKKGERIVSDARNMLMNYWVKENKLRNYFLLHIILSKVINENSANRATFLAMPDVCNSAPHVLWGNLHLMHNEDKWNVIKEHSIVHKLSHKKRFIQGDIYNFYMALIEGKLV